MIDSHVHIALPNVNYYTTRHLYINQLLNMMQTNNVKESYVFLDPAFLNVICKNYTDRRHKTKLISNDRCKLICSKCRSILYDGEDIFHNYNIELLNLVSKYVNLKPLVFLTPCKGTINKEVEFFEKNFVGKFYGYKLLPTHMSVNMDGININSCKPILIHGVDKDIAYNKSIINFAKRYKGNIIVAHTARLPKIMFEAINKIPNLYTDLSPFCATIRKDLKNKDKGKVFRELLEKIDNNKIVFGTDAPYGKYEEEINFVNSMNLDKETYDKITETNINKIFK